MSNRVFPVVRKSKFGNYYTGNLLVDGKFVNGITATGKNKKECSEHLILAWSRRLAQEAHIDSLKADLAKETQGISLMTDDQKQASDNPENKE